MAPRCANEALSRFDRLRPHATPAERAVTLFGRPALPANPANIRVEVLRAFRIPASGPNLPRLDVLEMSAEVPPVAFRLLARKTPGRPGVLIAPPSLQHAAALSFTDRATAAAVVAEVERVALDYLSRATAGAQG